jgi:hypothetical protein
MNSKSNPEPYKHGMSSPGQTPTQAWEKANEYVRNEIQLARELEGKNKHAEALVHLGNAIHTMGDTTSPMHQGYQTWHEDRSDLKKYKEHTKYEFYDPGYGSELDVQTDRAWDLFTSKEPIPNEVLPKP